MGGPITGRGWGVATSVLGGAMRGSRATLDLVLTQVFGKAQARRKGYRPAGARDPCCHSGEDAYSPSTPSGVSGAPKAVPGNSGQMMWLLRCFQPSLLVLPF